MGEGQVQAGAGLAEFLRRQRLASGLTQEELAGRSGLSVRTIANLERGRIARPHRNSVRRLADALALPESHRRQLESLSRLPAGGDHAGSLDRARQDPTGQQPDPAEPGRQAVPRQLPAAVPDFVGRSKELLALTGLLDQTAGSAGTVLISAIGGTAGVGKTALAVHWAHRVADRFPDGQLYVNLRGYDSDRPVSAADALAGFLRTLGMAGQDIPAAADERAATYRSLIAGRLMLVVLDNAVNADQVRPLLPGTPGCVTVVTSRDAMAGLVARDGGRRLALDLMPLPDAVRLLRILIGARVDDEPDAAETLAGQCCRLPLALRVAAELVVGRPDATIAGLVDELADQQQRLDLMDANGDQQTAIRAVFYRSYRHLDPAAARAFRLIGLHPGPDFDSYAIAALAGATLGWARRVLDQLARAQLVQLTGSGRAFMHDLLRAYSRDLVGTRDSQDERNAAMERLFGYYLGTARAAVETLALYGRAVLSYLPSASLPATPAPAVTDRTQARTWLDAHLATLTAVSAQAADNGWPLYATALAAALFRYHERAGHYSELVATHNHAIRAARQVGDHAVEAEALNNLSVVDLRQGRYEQAANLLNQALAAYRADGNQIGAGRALGNLGIAYYLRGDYLKATDCQTQALQLYSAEGDREGEARTLNNLGLIDQQLGRYQQAAERYNRALALHHEAGDHSSAAIVLSNLGLVDLRQGHYEQAVRQFQKSLALSRQAGHPFAQTEALNSLGEAFFASGDVKQSHRYYSEALALAIQTDDKKEEARAHNGLGHGCCAVGDSAGAREHWLQALRIYSAIGAPEANQVRVELTSQLDPASQPN